MSKHWCIAVCVWPFRRVITRFSSSAPNRARRTGQNSFVATFTSVGAALKSTSFGQRGSRIDLCTCLRQQKWSSSNRQECPRIGCRSAPRPMCAASQPTCGPSCRIADLHFFAGTGGCTGQFADLSGQIAELPPKRVQTKTQHLNFQALKVLTLDPLAQRAPSAIFVRVEFACRQ